jgi:hypothetical protein
MWFHLKQRQVNRLSRSVIEKNLIVYFQPQNKRSTSDFFKLILRIALEAEALDCMGQKKISSFSSS